jgi:hypothetical protein
LAKSITFVNWDKVSRDGWWMLAMMIMPSARANVLMDDMTSRAAVLSSYHA